MNYTYLLECSDGSLYCGWTNNLEKRVKAHNEGRGGKYTRSRLPVSLVYYEAYDTKKEAMQREWEIKRMSRKSKLGLLQTKLQPGTGQDGCDAGSTGFACNGSAGDDEEEMKETGCKL